MREREREWLKYRNVKVDFQLLAEKKEIQFLFKQKSQKKKNFTQYKCQDISSSSNQR